MEQVAGDPTDPAYKIIIIATHFAALLPLCSISELPALMFFNSIRAAPAQVPADAAILKRAKLSALISRLSATHRLAMFAERVLLVQGPSDEIVATLLARRLDLRLLARNAQILPVTGKVEFVEAAKLFRLMDKEVADLDALADDNALACSFSELPAGGAVANGLGYASVADLDCALRNDLAAFIISHQDAVRATPIAYPDWSGSDPKDERKRKRRVTLARILTDPANFGGAAADDAAGLRKRYLVLPGALAQLGCFFLHRGAIENYYVIDASDRSKPDFAAQEAATFMATEPVTLRERYADLVVALVHIAPNQRVDEDLLPARSYRPSWARRSKR